MAVQKRERVEPVAPVREQLVIKVGEREYPIPHLSWKEYKSILKVIDVTEEQIRNMSEEESLQVTMDFYYKLLKSSYPEIQKKELEDMPLYQLGAEFFTRLKIELFRIPLA